MFVTEILAPPLLAHGHIKRDSLGNGASIKENGNTNPEERCCVSPGADSYLVFLLFIYVFIFFKEKG